MGPPAPTARRRNPGCRSQKLPTAKSFSRSSSTRGWWRCDHGDDDVSVRAITSHMTGAYAPLTSAGSGRSRGPAPGIRPSTPPVTAKRPSALTTRPQRRKRERPVDPDDVSASASTKIPDPHRSVPAYGGADIPLKEQATSAMWYGVVAGQRVSARYPGRSAVNRFTSRWME